MPSDPQQLKALFLAAAAIPSPAERAAWLDHACAGDAALREQLDALLKLHDDASGFLAQAEPGQEPTAATAPPSPPPQAVGSRIGPYRLLQLLGEGGMGTVWVAEQTEPVKRRVALKVIKLGMDSALVLRRFEAERQALALMDHTHIAKVFDAGTTDTGRPYFVMELVHGVPLTRYCDELHLSIRERLELFVPVCQAIQHAHQKGIIHRDIKPSNVLVCMQDGKPVPKVIDFGVAKAISQPLTAQTLYTEYGAVVGTLEYMAPEQADMSPLGVDTRADVYALGVLLYELLTGTTPLDRKRLRGAAYVEMLRIIKEDDPPRPSMRLSDSKESLPGLAAQRRTEPTRLTKAVRGELDWIVMKCLEKDRTRRYESASAVARDVERHLHDEPVEACPPSAGYRLRKTVRRHRGPVLAATVALLALVIGIVGTSWGMLRADKAWTEEANRAEGERLAKEHEAEQRQLADRARKDTQKANGELAAKNHDLVQSQDRLEGALARAWLSPLSKDPAAELTEPEVSALEAVAAQRGKPLARRFLRGALGDARFAPRLRGRAEYAWQAAIGLDDRQRTEAETLVRSELESAEPSRRVDLALAAGALGNLTRRTANVAAGVLVQAMAATPSPGRLREFAQNLPAVAERLEPGEAAVAAATLTQAMDKTTNPNALSALADGLSALAGRLEPRAAAVACAHAVAALSRAMNRTTEPNALYPLAHGLSTVAGWPELAVAAVAAATLTQALDKTTDPNVLSALAHGLSALAGWLGPKEAAVCARAAAALTQAMSKTMEPYTLRSLANALSVVASRLGPKQRAVAAAKLIVQPPLAIPALSGALSGEASEASRRRFAFAAGIVGAAARPAPILPESTLLQVKLFPAPPLPLSAQTLVDLLKHPLCVREARRLVLAQLSRHYHRPFADQWDFVRYVHEHHLNLDLTTPPKIR